MKLIYAPLALTAALLMTACETMVAPADTATTTDAQETQTTQSEPRASGGHSKKGFIKTYDTDGDGNVTLAEFMAEREKGYNRRDSDQDGSVYEEEYVSEYEGRLKQQLDDQHERQIKQAYVRFDVLDSDDDTVITLEEFNASGNRMFSRLDTNEDGVVNTEDTTKKY